MPEKRTGDNLLGHCAEVLRRRLQAENISPAKSCSIALRVVDDLRAAFGGQMLYFPRGGITKDERAEQILDEWRGGRSVGEIAERLRLSVTYVYQMLARGRQNARLRAGAHVSPTTEAKTDGH